MTDVLDNINAFLYDNFTLTIPTPHVIDVIEIIIIAFFIYEILLWIKNSRAYMLLRGIVVIILFFVVAGLLLVLWRWLSCFSLSSGLPLNSLDEGICSRHLQKDFPEMWVNGSATTP